MSNQPMGASATQFNATRIPLHPTNIFNEMNAEDQDAWNQLQLLTAKWNIGYLPHPAWTPTREVNWERVEQLYMLNMRTFSAETLVKLLEAFEKFSIIRALRFIHREQVRTNESESGLSYFPANQVCLMLRYARCAPGSDEKSSWEATLSAEVRPLVIALRDANQNFLSSHPFKKLVESFPKVLNDAFIVELSSGVTL